MSLSTYALAVCAAAILGVPQDSEAGQRSTFALFSAELPRGWRAMTPDEMFALEHQLPFAMRVVDPGSHFAIGDVDRWLESGFDGRTLLVDVQGGEVPVDPSTIEELRAHWRRVEPDGGKREVLSAETVELGPNRHPAILCRVLTAASGSTPAIAALEFYVPTSAHTLILGFRSWEDDFENVREVYESIAATLTFPRPPRGPEELSDKLLQAALIGALVGVAIIVVRLTRRRGPAPGSER